MACKTVSQGLAVSSRLPLSRTPTFRNHPFASCSKTEGSLKAAYGLCQRMMHFFHQYLLYVTFEVLEPHWMALQTALKAANSLDEVTHPFSCLIREIVFSLGVAAHLSANLLPPASWYPLVM